MAEQSAQRLPAEPIRHFSWSIALGWFGGFMTGPLLAAVMLHFLIALGFPTNPSILALWGFWVVCVPLIPLLAHVAVKKFMRPGTPGMEALGAGLVLGAFAAPWVGGYAYVSILLGVAS